MFLTIKKLPTTSYTEICIIPCHLLSTHYKKKKKNRTHHNHPLRIKSETDSRMQTAQESVAPAACQLCSRLYLFLRVFLQRRQVVEGPCLWRMEEGNVHSNILSGAYSLSVSLASISGSGWIWCGEDAAAPISDVLPLSLSTFNMARTCCKLLGVKGGARNIRAGFMSCVQKITGRASVLKS